MKKIILNYIRKLLGADLIINEVVKSFRQIINETRYDTRRFLLQDQILKDREPGVSGERYVGHDIIVSLTTHGKRINDVAFTIESIMQQTIKANKIVLWLGNEDKDKPLPQALINQQKRGLEIYYCEDIRAYTKLIPSLKKYPDAAIITIDDDLLYEYDIIERLITAYKAAPEYIHACRVHRIGIYPNKHLIPYSKWEWHTNEVGPNKFNFVTGVGSVLYPPHCFDDEVFNKDTFMRLSKYNDDIWYTAMAIKNGTLINKIATRTPQGEDYLVNENVQDLSLMNINNFGARKNDEQMNAVFEEYGIIDRLLA